MKILKYILITLFLFNFKNLHSIEKKHQALNNEISKNIRCLICQGQSVYDSQSDFANSMKLLINQKIEQGLSKKEIYELLKKKYGSWIVYEPEFNEKTYILWILPILFFVAGGAIIIKKFKVKKK